MLAILGKQELDALERTMIDLLSAVQKLRNVLEQLDAMPAPETPREVETRAMLKQALIGIHAELLMPPVTLHAIVKSSAAAN